MQNAIPIQLPRRGAVWMGGYALLLVVTGMILYNAIDTAPVIWQTEAEIGRTLTCDEAYTRREIDATLYAEHRTQADIVYLFNLGLPVWLVLFGVFTLMVYGSTVLSRRIRLIATAASVTLATIILLYLPAIQLIACATE